MNRSTLGTAKDPASGISRVLGLCAIDPRFTSYVNEAQEILLPQGKWRGTYQEFRICTCNGCLTWPREILTIEQAAVCDQPITIRNQWYSYLPFGPGIQGKKNVVKGLPLIDRGEACTFADMIGIVSKIKVYADVAEAAGSKILLQGNDENGNWIRTLVSGEWVDGEYVTISTTPTLSTHIFSSLVSVQKPLTNGAVRLYAYDTVLLTQYAIAIYQPDELLPVYRRSFIPGLDRVKGTCCSNPPTPTNVKPVRVMAKLRYIPARLDTDFLLISNIPALKNMCQSIRKREANLFAEADAWEAKAVKLLRQELAEYLGDGAIVPIRMTNPYQVGAVENLV